jgi:hypothetical protein
MSARSPLLRDGSVARDHLQPHQRNSGGTTINSSRTITQQVIEDAIDRTVGARQERRSEQRLMKQVIRAEQRAKAYAASYNRAFRWQINHNKEFTTATWDVVPFDHEVLRTPGAEVRGIVTDTSAVWELRGLKRNTGRWFIGADLLLRATVPMGVDVAWIGIFKDGVLYSAMNAVDNGYAGETPIQDIALHVNDIVTLERGSVIDVRIYLDTGGGAGDQTFIAPSSVQGKVYGFRLECDTDRIGATTAGTGFGYVFNP